MHEIQSLKMFLIVLCGKNVVAVLPMLFSEAFVVNKKTVSRPWWKGRPLPRTVLNSFEVNSMQIDAQSVDRYRNA